LVLTSTFDGFTSRWTSPSACAAASALATWAMMPIARAAGSRPERAMTSPRSWPVTSRMSMKSWPSISPKSWIGTMCGSVSRAATSASRRNRAS
jgi:hypothetical protein